MSWEHKEFLKNKLGDYLYSHGFTVKKRFECLNNCSGSKKNTMSFYDNGTIQFVKCFRCNKIMDIFDIIGIDNNLYAMKDKYEYACNLYNLHDDYINSKDKNKVKNSKNELLKKQEYNKAKKLRYDKFYNKLVDKRKELLTKIETIKDKNCKEYQDIAFKLEFVDEYSNMIIEYNDNSIKLISEFKANFEEQYNIFKKYYLDIDIQQKA